MSQVKLLCYLRFKSQIIIHRDRQKNLHLIQNPVRQLKVLPFAQEVSVTDERLYYSPMKEILFNTVTSYCTFYDVISEILQILLFYFLIIKIFTTIYVIN